MVLSHGTLLLSGLLTASSRQRDDLQLPRGPWAGPWAGQAAPKAVSTLTLRCCCPGAEVTEQRRRVNSRVMKTMVEDCNLVVVTFYIQEEEGLEEPGHTNLLVLELVEGRYHVVM